MKSMMMMMVLVAMAAYAQAAISPGIPLEQIEVVMGYRGQMTQGRRVAPQPQLQCDPSLCTDCFCAFGYEPLSVTCENTRRRTDDGLFDWRCQEEMETLPLSFAGIRLASAVVSCEGYESSTDMNVLRGSCGVVYALAHTRKVVAAARPLNAAEFDALLFMVVVCIVITAVCWCTGDGAKDCMEYCCRPRAVIRNDHHRDEPVPPTRVEPSTRPPPSYTESTADLSTDASTPPSPPVERPVQRRWTAPASPPPPPPPPPPAPSSSSAASSSVSQTVYVVQPSPPPQPPVVHVSSPYVSPYHPLDTMGVYVVPRSSPMIVSVASSSPPAPVTTQPVKVHARTHVR